MKNSIIVAAVAAVLAGPVAHAESERAVPAEEVRQLREQLLALGARLDRLEQANQALAAANAELEARAGSAAELEARVAKVRTDLDATADQLARTRPNAPEWASRFALNGEFRYRHEQIWSGGDRATPAGANAPAVNTLDRVRDRMRLRFGGTMRVNDTVAVTMRLATGGDDARSANVTLGDGAVPANGRRAFGVDHAFVAWQPGADWLVRAGKMPLPWARPGISFFFDNDIGSEGVAVNWQRGRLFGSTSYMFLQERGPTQVVAGEGTVDVSDPAMAHVQAGVRFPLSADSTLKLGATYFDHFAVQGRRPFSSGSSFGNTTRNVVFPAGSTTSVAVLANDYDIVELFGQYDTVAFGRPLTLFADVARNLDAQLDTAWTAGFVLGRAQQPHTWELAAAYQVIEKDALFAQWIDSNFGSGVTDHRGLVMRAGYAFGRNMLLNATVFVNELNHDVYGPAAPRDRKYERVMLDTLFRF